MSHQNTTTGRETLIAIAIAAVIALGVGIGWSRQQRPDANACCDALALGAPLPPDPKVLTGRLRNGLRYFIRERHVESGVELRLVVNAGSVLEDDDQRGLAHAVEHMAFRGTQRFPGRAIVDTLEALGMRSGVDLNAYTGFDDTEYDLSLPSDSGQALERGVSILAEWAHGLRFDPAEAARESGVVLGEWRSGRSAARRLADARTALLLGGSRYAIRLPIGDTLVLRHFDVAAMRRFYRDWYRPDLMAVVAVGDFDSGRVEELVRREFGSIPAPEASRPRPLFEAVPSPRLRAAITTDPEATLVRVALWRVLPHGMARTVGEFRKRIAQDLFVSMLDARLAEAARRPDAPFLRASFDDQSLTRTTDGFALRADVTPAGVGRGVAALEAEVARVARDGFTSTELERQKAVLRRAAQSNYANGPGSSQLADEYADHFLTAEPVLGRDDEYALRQRLLPEIGLADVSRFAASLLPDSGAVVLLSAPARLAARLPDEQTLVRQARDGASRPPVPYTDAGSGAQILAREPNSGIIAQERARHDIGTIEWTLGNGMRVLVRPTHVESGRIELEAWAPGGASLVPDPDFASAYMSDRAVSATGIGVLDATALEKALAGHELTLAPYVSETEVGLSGEAAPRDVDLLFRLVYLYFTSPREDSAAFRVFRTRNEELLRRRGADPDAAFDDTVRATLADHAARSGLLSAAMYRTIDLHTALAFYRARFANASGFTTVIVGDASLDRLRPLVERYLASLPAGRPEEPRYLERRYPRGIIERTVRGGSEATSRTRLVFTGPVFYDQLTAQRLGALRELLQLRLESRLREELGATYDLGADLSVRTGPHPEYAFTIEFTSAPERSDQLVHEALAQIAELRAHGPSDVELEKIRAAERHDNEDVSDDDDFWLRELRSHARLGWPLEDIVGHAKLVNEMTAGSLRDAAARFLSPGDYVRVTRLPLPASDPHDGTVRVRAPGPGLTRPAPAGPPAPDAPRRRVSRSAPRPQP
ncbi:MAG TPA: insulinase family protein [Gemmatimonadaceae bacterium]|nr:insulinase family protein [Gemmatimonadaceae bacterium]